MIDRLDGQLFRDMVIAASSSVECRKQDINELNVFPVPDGDTGTNMSMTLNSASAELRGKTYKTLCSACDAVASAMLRGARGNSGVILSLLFRGFSKAMKERQTADASAVAAAMTEGVNAAYKAVMKPTEGTILTVARLAAAAASASAEEGCDIDTVYAAALSAAEDALAHTTEQNPVLKKAGVVDAGGMGYVTLLSAFCAVLRGEAPLESAPAADDSEAENVFSKFETEDIRFAYCTEFIVEKSNDRSVDLLRSFLSSIGDSAVVLDDEQLIKVHVHSNQPGDVLTEALKYGALMTVKVENMKQQHSQRLSTPAPTASPAPTCPLSIVSVCAGDGIDALFHELGADRTVSGGQTMNPSTEDILHAIEESSGETVIVLPNNKNIIMAAQQCIALAEKPVIVIPSATIPQGVAAILAADLELSPEENEAAMNDALAAVHTLSVTYAARDSSFDGMEIHEGEYLALKEGKLLCCTSEEAVLAEEIAAAVPDADMLTLYYGSDVSSEQAKRFSALLEAKLPQTELTLINGGQPVYYYIISAE